VICAFLALSFFPISFVLMLLFVTVRYRHRVWSGATKRQ
jgi:hypothetical protein